MKNSNLFKLLDYSCKVEQKAHGETCLLNASEI